MGTSRRLEVLGSAKALYEDLHTKVVVGIVGGHGSSEPPKTPAPDVRIEFESAGAPPEMAEDEQTPVVVGVPMEAFAWS